MNLFLIGWADGGRVERELAERTLRALHDRLPFFPDRPVESWTAASGTCVVASVSHGPGQSGGVEYNAFQKSRMALFSGRPIRWTGEAEADGRAPIDSRFYLPPASEWADDLDGRWAAARYDDADRALELATDALGAYPVFQTEHEGVRWFSNNAEVLRSLSVTREINQESVAGLIGGGWPLSGNPMWAAVRRLPPGVHRFAPGAPPERRALLPLEEIAPMLGAGFDVERAAAVLIAATRALADWPGRPNVVPVTGGRDSRLVLAGALAAGIDFRTTTGGAPGTPDVEVGQQLAGAAGVEHYILEGDPHGDIHSDWQRGAELLDLITSGTASLADAAGFPFGAREGPMLLWHSGQGGEIARGYYGSGDWMDHDALVDKLYRAFVARRPGRREILSMNGEELVRTEIASWVDRQLNAGVPAADVPDMFYLQRRMGTWAGPGHGAVEYVRDTTSPLWSRRLLPHMLGLPAEFRAGEEFHRRLVEHLAPALIDIPFADGQPWASSQHRIRRKAAGSKRLAGKVAGELKRRTAARLVSSSSASAGDASDPFDRLRAATQARVRGGMNHGVGGVLDLHRLEALLETDSVGLDTMSRYYVWRVATIAGAGSAAE